MVQNTILAIEPTNMKML